MGTNNAQAGSGTVLAANAAIASVPQAASATSGSSADDQAVAAMVDPAVVGDQPRDVRG